MKVNPSPLQFFCVPFHYFLAASSAKCVRDKKEASAGVILHIIQTGIDWKGIKNMQNIIKKAFFLFMRVFILHSILKLSRVGRGGGGECENGIWKSNNNLPSDKSKIRLVWWQIKKKWKELSRCFRLAFYYRCKAEKLEKVFRFSHLSPFKCRTYICCVTKYCGGYLH